MNKHTIPTQVGKFDAQYNMNIFFPTLCKSDV